MIIIKKDDIGNFLYNKTLVITAAGLDNGLRGKRDGITYFGEEEKKVIHS
jgi:hypothetical protein